MQSRFKIVTWFISCALFMSCDAGEMSVKPKRMIVIFVDVTRSLTESERDSVIMKSEAILDGLAPGARYEIYPIQVETEIVETLAQGKTLSPESDLDRRPRSKIKKLKQEIKDAVVEFYGRTPSSGDNQSCILNSLATASEAFRQFRGANASGSVELDLIFISDMIEECDRTPVGKIYLDKINIDSEVARISSGFSCDADMSDVHIGVIIPAAKGLDPAVNRNRRPDLIERKKFWRQAFVACGFPKERFADAQWFSFSANVPSRFQKKQ